jgi:hypothetical protein
MTIDAPLDNVVSEACRRWEQLRSGKAPIEQRRKAVVIIARMAVSSALLANNVLRRHAGVRVQGQRLSITRLQRQAGEQDVEAFLALLKGTTAFVGVLLSQALAPGERAYRVQRLISEHLNQAERDLDQLYRLTKRPVV